MYRAMTYNIRSGRNLENILNIGFSASVIEAADADLVCLNEVRSHTQDIGAVNQAEQLGTLLGWNWRFGRSIDVAGGEYGNALLSRHPILECEVVHIPDAPNDGSAYFEHRSILRAVLDVRGLRLTVLCTHYGLADSEQDMAVQMTLDLIGKARRPLLLMGDLNMSPDNPRLSPLFEALSDSAQGGAQPLTFPSGIPTHKIDYIFVDHGQRVLSLETRETQNSDHLPLIAVIE